MSLERFAKLIAGSPPPFGQRLRSAGRAELPLSQSRSTHVCHDHESNPASPQSHNEHRDGSSSSFSDLCGHRASVVNIGQVKKQTATKAAAPLLKHVPDGTWK